MLFMLWNGLSVPSVLKHLIIFCSYVFKMTETRPTTRSRSCETETKVILPSVGLPISWLEVCKGKNARSPSESIPIYIHATFSQKHVNKEENVLQKRYIFLYGHKETLLICCKYIYTFYVQTKDNLLNFGWKWSSRGFHNMSQIRKQRQVLGYRGFPLKTEEQ